MKSNKFITLCRYQHWTNEGKQWSGWYVYESSPKDENDEIKLIAKLKTEIKQLDMKSKLNHEYMMQLYEEYLDDMKQIAKNIKQLQQANAKYRKSAEYKNMLKAKRSSAKELKVKQIEYMKEHGIQTK